jgi:hypothetical protein
VSPTLPSAEATAQRAVAPAEDRREPAVLGYVHGRVGMLRAVLYADDRSLRQSLTRSRRSGRTGRRASRTRTWPSGATLRGRRPALDRKGRRTSSRRPEFL